MSVISRILYEDPDMLYALSGATPYVDLSRRRLSNISPTVVRNAVSPARGLAETVRISAQTTITVHKAPTDGFTLLALTKPLTTSATNILSFDGTETEGLWQTGDILTFGIKHVGGTTTTVSATIDSSRIHLVVGVYQVGKIALYCDGVEVATKDVTSTIALNVDNTLIIGDTSAQAVGLVGMLHRPLSGAAIAAIWESSRPTASRTIALQPFSAIDYRVSASTSDYQEFEYTDTHPSLNSGVQTTGNKIMPNYDTTLTSVAGNIRFALPFVDITAGIRVFWDSSVGATVKYSTDGTNFFTLYNGETFGSAGITNQPLLEVSFAGGSTAEMYLVGLKAHKMVTSNVLAGINNGRPITTAGSVSLATDRSFRDYPSLPITFGTNGTIVIAPETEDNTIMTNAIEFWYTPSTADLTGTKYLLDSSPAHSSTISFVTGKINFTGFSTVYVNKASQATNVYTLVAGVPIHIVAVYTTANNAQITLGRTTSPAQGTLTEFALLRTTISAGNVTSIFDGQQDIPLTTLASSSTVALSDVSVNTYQFAWTAGSQ